MPNPDPIDPAADAEKRPLKVAGVRFLTIKPHEQKCRLMVICRRELP